MVNGGRKEMGTKKSALHKLVMKYVGEEFESSIGETPQFKSFAMEFKKALKADAKEAGLEIVDFSKGHFYCSAFVLREDGKMFYICIWDVRMKSVREKQMWRCAKDERDFTGGQNHYDYIENIMEDIVNCQRHDRS